VEEAARGAGLFEEALRRSSAIYIGVVECVRRLHTSADRRYTQMQLSLHSLLTKKEGIN